MAISVSVEPDNHTQADGRRYVTEIYTDGFGEVTRRSYLSEDGADYQAIADARIPQVQATFARLETTNHLEQDLHST